jgi:hypothetical protein
MGYWEPEKRATRPSTVGWGLSEEGREWYNKALHSKEYWNGSEVKSVPGSSSGGVGHITDYNYCIDLDEGKAYDRTDILVDSDSNIADLINRIVALLPTAHARSGRIVLFSPTATARTFNKDITIGKRTYLEGISPETTILQASANMTDAGIVVDATDIIWTDWAIENLLIDMNSKNGHGIYSTHGDQTNYFCRQSMQNLRVYNVNPGYVGINVQDLRQIRMKHIRVRSSGTCIKFRTTSGQNTGDGVYEDFLLGGKDTTNWIGIDIAGNLNQAGTISTWNGIRIGGSGTYAAGTIGLKLVDCADMCFVNLHCEGQETNVYIQGTDVSGHYINNIDFFHPTFYNSGTDPNQAVWKFLDKIQGVNVFGGRATTAGSGKGINDLSFSTWRHQQPIVFYGHQFDQYGTSAEPPMTLTNNTRIIQGKAGGGAYYGTLIQEYQTQTGSWAAPTGTVWRGKMVMVYNSTQAAHRLYVYGNSGWYYTEMVVA